MKTIVCIIIAAMLGACSGNEPEFDCAVTVCVDVTDEIRIPSAAEVLRYSGILEDKDIGFSIRIIAINDIGTGNEYRVFSLEKGSINDEPDIRELEVKLLEEQIDSFMHELTQQPPRQKSVVTVTFFKALNILASANASKKTCLFVSDGYENSMLNFYRLDKGMENEDRKKLAGEMLKMQSLDNLSGITVYCLYKPRDYQDYIHHAKVMNIYEGILNEKGACLIEE
jgi:hypothetical protein